MCTKQLYTSRCKCLVLYVPRVVLHSFSWCLCLVLYCTLSRGTCASCCIALSLVVHVPRVVLHSLSLCMCLVFYCTLSRGACASCCIALSLVVQVPRVILHSLAVHVPRVSLTHCTASRCRCPVFPSLHSLAGLPKISLDVKESCKRERGRESAGRSMEGVRVERYMWTSGARHNESIGCTRKKSDNGSNMHLLYKIS